MGVVSPGEGHRFLDVLDVTAGDLLGMFDFKLRRYFIKDIYADTVHPFRAHVAQRCARASR